MKKETKIKTYSDCYLYNKYPIYNKILFDGVMSDSIDKGVDNFDEVVYEIKRTRISSGLVDVLKSPKTVLITPSKPMPKPFVAFVAKDPRDKNKVRKLFIDATNCIINNGDGYKVNDGRLVSHLINGYYAMYYSTYGNKSTMFNVDQAKCFVALFTHIIDFIGKISVIDNARDKCTYLAARYFLEGIAGVAEERSREIARTIAGISEAKESMYVYIEDNSDECFTDLREFIRCIKNQFKIDKLTVDIVVEKWMYLYGPGTVFALEYLPALSAMITDAYVGSYINNQKTIEKICGKSMVALAKSMISRI